MTDTAPEPQPSRIVITFAPNGGADLSTTMERVSLGQVMAAAWFLDTYAHELRADALAKQAQLVVPGGPITNAQPFQGPNRAARRAGR